MALAREAKDGAAAQAGEGRPLELWPLFEDVARLSGVGPDLARRLPKLLGREAPRVWDLLGRLPKRALDMTALSDLEGVADGAAIVVEAQILEHLPPTSPRRPYKIRAEAAGEEIDLVFFNDRGGRLRERFAEGRLYVVRGRLTRFGGRAQIAHPSPLAAERPEAAPVYPLAAGIAHRRLEKAVAAALDKVPELPEWLEADRLARRGWPSWREALIEAHRPSAAAEDFARAPARRRLAHDELLANHLALALIRRRRAYAPGRAWPEAGSLRRALLDALPFELTAGQRAALDAIDADLGAPAATMRLVQGDVGAGKTLVAILAMARVIEAGGQAALMAPTDLLARQHHATIERLLGPLGVRSALLLGRDPESRKKAARAKIAAGEAQIAVGAHGLVQGEAQFADLGLAVVDEQHRFGVHQRMELKSKGAAVDMIAMTATPIPRSLVLCRYGDVAVSEIRDKPPGRPEIRTVAASIERIEEIEEACARAIERGERVYWVCPSIDGEDAPRDPESEARPASVQARFEALSARFPGAVGLAHGRLSAAAKAEAMAAFADGRTPILAATTVIEVGVDVPEATVMVIEDAGRFGLAALHQLRGRIGRGVRASTCVLAFAPPLGFSARRRIETLRRSQDGFEIAETDLELRGSGEILGVKQSGAPDFRFAELGLDGDLLESAREEAERLARAPERRRAASILLHLFERPDAARLLGAG